MFRIRPVRLGFDCMPGMIVGPAKIDRPNNCERTVRTGCLISHVIALTDAKGCMAQAASWRKS